MFKKMMRALGVSGATVDTVLDNPNCLPGGTLRGQVHLAAGEGRVEVEHITVDLVTRVEREHVDHEASGSMSFLRAPVAGPMVLQPGARQSMPFRLQLPWETPVTHLYGQPLRGMVMGVATEVSIARAVDKGDLDPVAVHPLPVQEQILAAFEQLGFRFKGADLEAGHLHGVSQTLPFYQEIEFFPPQYAHGVNEVEVTFVAGPHGMDVVLEVDKRGGMFHGSHDVYGHLRVDYPTADQTDWAAQIDAWLRQLVDRGAHYGQPAPGYAPGHGYPGGHGPAGPDYHPGQHGGYGHPGHDEHHRHGSGMGAALGGAAVGAAAGFAAGMVADEVFEEVGDFFGGDEED